MRRLGYGEEEHEEREEEKEEPLRGSKFQPRSHANEAVRWWTADLHSG